jgi:hypothetical protein
MKNWPWKFLFLIMVLLLAISGFAIFSQIPVKAQDEDVPSIDIPTTVATTSAVDIEKPNQQVYAKAPDYLGVDHLASWEGDRSPKIDRFHDRQSGVEFICVRDRGCVLTGRKW